MTESPFPSQRARNFGATPARLRDNVLLKIAARALRNMTSGELCVTLPSGASARFTGSGGSGVRADVTLKTLRPLWQSMRRGSMGFAEGYITGDLETSDVGSVIRLFIDNYDALAAKDPGVFAVRGADKAWHRKRSNTREGSRRNIAAHYDLGNRFYELWLDRSMTYSSAVYGPGTPSLEDAQAAKYARILAALGLEAGHEVLEIGCGWGGLAERIAHQGAKVDAITVSREQHDYAARRLAEAGLVERAKVRFEDYRDVAGLYDRIVSVEMIEAVGEEHWPRYFATLRDRLKPGGSAVIQAITIRDQDFQLYRSRPDFIQRYIFPGGMLLTDGHIRREAEAAGLSFELVEHFGTSYARTLAEWRRRFHAAWPEIAALGFDTRFRRMWDYYLSYCETAFDTGCTNVGIYRLRKI